MISIPILYRMKNGVLYPAWFAIHFQISGFKLQTSWLKKTCRKSEKNELNIWNQYMLEFNMLILMELLQGLSLNETTRNSGLFFFSFFLVELNPLGILVRINLTQCSLQMIDFLYLPFYTWWTNLTASCGHETSTGIRLDIVARNYF